jgi:hypothetical protein
MTVVLTSSSCSALCSLPYRAAASGVSILREPQPTAARWSVGPSFHDGFVASGAEPPSFRLKLTLDTASWAISPRPAAPGPARFGRTTRRPGLCAGGKQPLFQSSPLRAIQEVNHDALSTLSFGEGHDDDFFFAWVDSTCQGTMLALVSLLRSGDVEVRLFKPAPFPPPDAGRKSVRLCLVPSETQGKGLWLWVLSV